MCAVCPHVVAKAVEQQVDLPLLSLIAQTLGCTSAGRPATAQALCMKSLVLGFGWCVRRIVKNSWGAEWGDHGYIRMRRDVGDFGQCGIAMQVRKASHCRQQCTRTCCLQLPFVVMVMRAPVVTPWLLHCHILCRLRLP